MTRVFIQLLICVLFVIGALPAALRMGFAIFQNPNKAWDIAKAMDDLLNVQCNGKPRQWVSTRAAQARQVGQRWGCVLCKLLDRVDAGHCDRALVDAKQNLKE